MKILIDMNLSPLWVHFLADQGIESLHWSTVGEPSAADAIILEYAAVNGYVVLTHDLDFGLLLAHRKVQFPSVVQIRHQDVLPSAIGAMVTRAIYAAAPHLKTGALVTVDIGRHRLRILPI